MTIFIHIFSLTFQSAASILSAESTFKLNKLLGKKPIGDLSGGRWRAFARISVFVIRLPENVEVAGRKESADDVRP